MATAIVLVNGAESVFSFIAETFSHLNTDKNVATDGLNISHVKRGDICARTLPQKKEQIVLDEHNSTEKTHFLSTGSS